MGERRGDPNPDVIYLVHCENFCKCYNVPTPSTTIKKNDGQEGKTGPVWELALVGGEDIRKGCRRVKYYILMYENGKIRPVETIPGLWGGVG
jgi:hypothetical protein